MASVNKVILLGNVGRDPEIRYTGGGEPIANFSIATSEKWKDKETGEQKEHTDWHRIEVFGKTADVVKNYVTKGKQLYVEGTLRIDKWEDKDGNKRETPKIRVAGPNSRLVLLGSRSDAAPPEKKEATDDDLPF